MRGVAGAQRVKIERSHVDSRVSILKGSDGSFSLRVAMAGLSWPVRIRRRPRN